MGKKERAQQPHETSQRFFVFVHPHMISRRRQIRVIESDLETSGKRINWRSLSRDAIVSVVFSDPGTLVGLGFTSRRFL